MSEVPEKFGRSDPVPNYLVTRRGEAVDSIRVGGKVVQVLFEGVRSSQDMILSTPLHICVNQDCCQSTVVRHSAINPIGNGVDALSVNLRCINCDTRYSRICSPGEVHTLDDRAYEVQRELERTVASVTQENMAEDVRNLILGLRLNLVGPDDFTTTQTSWVDMMPPTN